MGQRRLCSQALSVSSGVMSCTMATYLQAWQHWVGAVAFQWWYWPE